jgi:hypothetical protein
MESDDGIPWALIIPIVLLALMFSLEYISGGSRKREIARDAERKEIEAERKSWLERPVPPDVKRSMSNFLSGKFTGEDRSPLAYVGYQVGKSGLPEWDRRRRLEVCFRSEIPDDLDRKYLSWGTPVSQIRFEAMYGHLRMLADMRRFRQNYEVAVAEWDEDADWLRSELGPLAGRLARLRPGR